VRSPLARARQRIAPPTAVFSEEVGADAPGGPVALATAAMRYRAAAVNYVRLRKLFLSERPRAVLLNNGGYPGAESCRVAALAAHASGVPTIVQFVHNVAYPPAWPAGAELAYDRRVDCALDAWVTAAGRAGDALSRLRAIPRDRIETVYYGIPQPPRPSPDQRSGLRAELGFGEDDFGVLVVAAFERRKGHMVLLEALSETSASVRIALVGSGDEEQSVRERVGQLGLGERVRFLGWRDDVDALLDASDLLVLPSLSNECLPYAILEAMSHALPVVGTDVAGIPEEIDNGVTGEIVPPGDAAALAAAIRRLATDRGRAVRMGEAGAQRRRSMFDRDAMTVRMSELLRLPCRA